MTLLFGFKPRGLGSADTAQPSPSPNNPLWDHETEDEYEEEYDDEDDDDDEDEEEDYDDDEGGEYSSSRRVISGTPFISPMLNKRRENNEGEERGGGGLTVLDLVVAALRKSLLVTCSVEEREELSSLDISCPTDVRHVSHVTFDRFNGFLGLPHDLQHDLPHRVPSASASVFGVSPQSMQCSIDERRNSVPTLLIMMQKRLYAQGGLKAEGIFRINAENSQEECVRGQLNRGIVPRDIDVHCLAGLIKAWFRELPKGVLDCLTPEQVMHCNTEDQCTQLVTLLPPMEAGLLDWAINLMADVVLLEQYNKMNARNIAMVFAPNMTQMADPLTALIHAVQVMNLLKTLIERTIRLREESTEESAALSPSSDFLDRRANPHPSTSFGELIFEKQQEVSPIEQPHCKKLIKSVTLDRLEFSDEHKHRKTQKLYNDDGTPCASISSPNSPVMSSETESAYEAGEGEGILDRLNLRKSVKKLCKHPVFLLNKPTKKTGELEIVNNG